MKEYKVKKEDLIGEIKGFPIEVVQKMINYQVEQGNKADTKVFQVCVNAGYFKYGFIWCQTVEGMDFWEDVIYNKHFDLFFERYPKK